MRPTDGGGCGGDGYAHRWGIVLGNQHLECLRRLGQRMTAACAESGGARLRRATDRTERLRLMG